MDVSIIIVSWNAKEYLFKCLKSLNPDTANQFKTEIIVVDNASSDGSPEMVKREFPNVNLICNNDNLGFAKANNIGIKQSAGKYICLINSDVVVLKDCISSMLGYMDKHPEVGMLGPKILGQDGVVQRSCMGFPTFWNSLCRALSLDTTFPKTRLFGGQLMTYWSHDSIRSVEVINGCFWMIRRKAINHVGLLDEKFFIYGEDIDWCRRFWKFGWMIVFFPYAEAIHYGGASSSNAPIRFFLEMHRANYQYWKKHHGRSAQIGFLLITLLHHVIRMFGQSMIYIIKPSNRIQAGFKIRRSAACMRWLFNFENLH